MKKVFFLITSLLIIVSYFNFANPAPAQASSNSNMINDTVFDSAGSMSAMDIQLFLNRYPNSCLKNYTDEYPTDYFSYSSSASAASIIRRASDLWGINPQVLLTKLEQEENLVTGNAGCPLYRYVSAVGFNCPGPTRDAVFRGTPVTTCVQNDQNMGFARQVTKGAWLLKWGKERANGNLSWLVPDDATYYYGGPMTQGTRQRSSGSPAVYYDGVWNGTYISNGATASLYNYTPYFNQAFSGVFQSFFGADPSVQPNPYHPASIFRMYFPWNGEHFYSASYGETVAIVGRGAKFEGVAYLAPNYTGSIPVHRFWQPGGKHFYTINEGERNYVQNTLRFTYEGVVYYAQPTQVPSTIPVFRLWQPSSGDHLYTTNTAERDGATRAGYIYEGVAFYAY